MSKLFYERLGEEVANELVDWFNQVDATYRGDLRELNELNFARSDAKLEQRLAELRSEFRERLGEVRAELRDRIGEVRAELIKWMFIFWAATIVPLAGLKLALHKL